MREIRKVICHCGSVELETEFTDGLQTSGAAIARYAVARLCHGERPYDPS
jgi:hypothetical protein